MKVFLSSILFLISCLPSYASDKDSFEIRGVLPWHNFLSGPSAWNETDYEKYLDECKEQNINFIGFHNYTGGGERYAPYVEPMIKISYKNIVPAAQYDNSLSARWGYLPMPVKDFVFGTDKAFNLPQPAVAYGADCSILSTTKEEHYANSQRLMQSVLKMAHARGMQMAMGFEFGVLPPEYFSLNGFYWSGEANMVPNPSHEIAIELHYAAIDNILETYKGIDYIWLWLNEHSFMGVDAAKIIREGGKFSEYYKAHQHLFEESDDEKSKFIGVWSLKYLELTEAYLKEKAPHVKIILGGWGGGNQLPSLMRGLDRGVSSNIIFSCLNPALGDQPQADFLGDIAKNRKVWAIPWLEGDHQLWHLQPRVSLLKNHVELAAKQNLDGVLAIHWRTEDVKLNKQAFSHFASNKSKPKSVDVLYKEYIEQEFGKSAIKSLLADLIRWDSEDLNSGISSPEYFIYTPHWGNLNEKNYAFRQQLVDKITQTYNAESDAKHKENLLWLKNSVKFELLLHDVNAGLLLSYQLKKQYIEEGMPPTKEDVQKAKAKLASIPIEEMFKTYASKCRSRGELGVLSSLNQRVWQTYTELSDFLNNY